MAGVLRVADIAPTATEEDMKNVFQSINVLPLDVHWVLNIYGKRTGTAFIAFQNKDLRKGTTINGLYFRGSRMIVQPSSHNEFNQYFPGTPMVRNPDWKKTLPYSQQIDNFNQNRNQQAFIENDPYHNQNRSHGDVRNDGFNASNINYNPSNYEKFNDNSSYDPSAPFNVPKSVNVFSGYTTNETRQENSSKDGSNPYIKPTTDTHRSRSPHDTRIVEDKSESKYKSKRKSEEKKTDVKSKSAKVEGKDINEKKYVRIFGMSFDCSVNDFKKFLKPLDVRDVLLLKFKSGDNAGKPNGSAIVEMQKEEQAIKALGLDGNNFNSRPIQVVRTAKDDIVAALDARKKKAVLNVDLKTLNDLANSNPEIQRLIGLLNDAVAKAKSKDRKGTSSTSSTKSDKSKSTQSNSSSSNKKNQSSSSHKKDQSSTSRASDRSSSSHKSSTSAHNNDRSSSSHIKDSHNGSKHRDDPVINRVANSANINVDYIKERKVVGLRNLPSQVNTEMILDFFRGYNRVDDSVRIHYLENGRCSGDAIIAFRTTDEATRAVQNLNKKSVDGRKVELFFL